MSRTLALQNRQQARPVDMRRLRGIARWAIEELFGIPEYALAVHLIEAEEIAALNEAFLRHEGPTDVITFDHRESRAGPGLHGEIFICMAVAGRQARRFGTTWQNELVRYLLHGLLHLLGHDDTTPAARRKMKRHEERALVLAAKAFPLRRLARPRR